MTGRNSTSSSSVVAKQRGRTYELELSSAGGSDDRAGSVRSADLSNKIVFKVARSLTKPAIMRAVEQLFEVRVDRVQMVRRRGSTKLSKSTTRFLRPTSDAGLSSAHWLIEKSAKNILPKAGPQPLLPLNVGGVLTERQLTPQAVIKRSVSKLALNADTVVSKGADDFDEYRGFAFQMGAVVFAILHYKGHPRDTATVYLPSEISDVDDITRTLKLVTESLGIPAHAIAWQRRDDTDL